MNRVLLVDDHPMIRTGLEATLRNKFLVCEVYHADDVPKAEDILNEHTLELVICDITLGPSQQGGLDLLTRWGKKVPFIMLSMYEAEWYVERSMTLGAKAYVAKGGPPQQLVEVISALLEKRPVQQATPLRDEKAMDPLHNLSQQESQVYLGIARGMGLKDLSLKLNLKYSTVATYRKRILEKLDLSSSSEIIQHAVRNRLIQA